MVRHRWSYFVGACALALCVAAFVQADDERSVPRREALEKPQDLDIGFYVPGDPPDALESTDEEGTIAGGAFCEPIGLFENDAAGAPRFRGNAYRITGGAAKLREFKMQLRFNGAVDLYFSVYQRRPTGNIYDLVFFTTRPGQSGNATTRLYSSGSISPVLTLEEDAVYAIGVGWGSGISVTYARSDEQQPTDFLGGQVIGFVQSNLAQPLGDPTSFNTPSPSGAYSMQICLEPAPGACCNATLGMCKDVLEGECTGAGTFFHGQRTRCAETLCRFGACCSKCDSSCKNDYTPQACDDEDGIHHPGATCPTTTGGLEALCPVVTGACCAGDCDDTRCEAECEGVYRGDGTTCAPDHCVGACCPTGSSRDCVEVSEPFCENFLSGTFRGSAQRCILLDATQTCQDGACCATEGGTTGCRVVDRTECSAANDLNDAVYLGDGTTCPARRCVGGANNGNVCTSNAQCPQGNCQYTECPAITRPEVGACCLPHGECINTKDEATCQNDQIGGVFSTANCSEGACIGQQPGACCYLDGTCERLTATACSAVDAYPAAPGVACSVTVCENATPAGLRGACCDAFGDCTPKREVQCRLEEGQYHGDDTDCDDVTCTPFGACCLDDGTCTDGVTADLCETLSGAYQQDGSECLDVAGRCDQRRACCTSTHQCLLLMPTECEKLGGNFREDVLTCTGQACGACCDGGANCSQVVSSQCTAMNSQFTPGKGCDEVQATCKAIGACCLTNGDCVRVLPSECETRNGFFQGNNSICDAGGCGSCCEGGIGGECKLSIAPPANCAGPQDVFHTDANCDVDRPCDPRGACCVTTGEMCIRNQLEKECAGQNGTYLGDDSTCQPEQSECLPDDADPICPCARGSCCRINGCENNQLRRDCQGPGALFDPVLSCGQVGCPRGACCKDAGCQILAEGRCEAEPDMKDEFRGGYVGHFIECDEELAIEACTPAACCLPDAERPCAMLSRPQCEQERGEYLVGLSCQTAGTACQRGSCCLLDGSCDDNQIVSTCDDPEDFSIDRCSIRTCTSRGACCVGTAPRCRLTTEAECVDTLQGVYAGAGIDCDAAPCPGACCKGDGTCSEINADECTIGSFRGPGTTCAEANCCQFVIFNTDPPNCAIDAGRVLTGPTDVVARPPWKVIEYEYQCPPEETPSFTVRVVPAGPGPTVTNVELVGDVATITLSEPIALEKWTCLVQDETLAEVCFGWFPGNVTGNGLYFYDRDVSRLIEHLEDPAGSPLPVHSCDANRSNGCFASDIIDLGDIFNPRKTYLLIPTACPTAPPSP